jgi:predicted alpha/beta superfamily hydrolase
LSYPPAVRYNGFMSVALRLAPDDARSPAGRLLVRRDFVSPPEGLVRTVRVYVPEAYAHAPTRHFPVLYMHDGQNVFAHPESATWDTWCANLTLEALVRERQVEPWLIVAVDSGDSRMWDYSPWDEPRAGVKARGPAYARFLVEHLKPWVDATWRTRPGPEWTAVMGSSLGGLISLYLGLEHADVFGRIGALSPSVMWSEERLFEAWRPPGGPRRSRIYMDSGFDEYCHPGYLPMRYGEATRDFHQHLRRLGHTEDALRFVQEVGGEHHERDWARRLPLALRWLLA